MIKSWLHEYSPWVPEQIDPDAYPSTIAMIEESLARFADRPAFANFDRVLTYAEVDQLSLRIAARLQSDFGVGPGDRVAIMAPNILQYPLTLIAIMRAGGVIVNVNPMYTPRELAHQLSDSGAKIIFVFDAASGALRKVAGDSGIETVIVLRLGDLLGDGYPQTDLQDAFDNMVEFRTLLDNPSTVPLQPVEMTGDDVLLLQYTGGTTGLSKGATLTHRNMVANLVQFSSWFGDIFRPGQEVVLTALPMYHIFALMVNTLTCIRQGGLCVLITDPRDTQHMLNSFERWNVTVMTGVNTLFNGLLNAPGIDDVKFSLRMSMGGGAAVQKAVAERWQALTGTQLLEGYGLSETSPILTCNKADLAEFSGSVGLPLPSTEIKLIDDDGNEVAIGEPGELCARGPQVMRGYWNRDDATAEVMTSDGFFRTGDIATVDDKGYFRIVDRKKDMIIVSGFNVFPNEIEDVVIQCPGVLENACVGVPNEKTGEAVCVYIVRQPQAPVDEAQVTAFCREHLTGYKIPRVIRFVDELPKSNVGKILRRELRDIALRQLSAS